jgi:Cu(I)-responsive transcriptional regulator
MNISTAAARSGVPAKTIRYYEEIGLIPAAERTAAGYRRYGAREVETLRFVNRARSLGFPVPEVKVLLELWHDDGRASRDVRETAERHLTAIERKLRDLAAMRDTLRDLVDRCHGDDRPDCPILRDLAGGGLPEEAPGDGRSDATPCRGGRPSV